MTTINLKDFYPWYTHDEYIEVSEEVAEFKICTPNDYLFFVSLVTAGDTFRNKTVGSNKSDNEILQELEIL